MPVRIDINYEVDLRIVYAGRDARRPGRGVLPHDRASLQNLHFLAGAPAARAARTHLISTIFRVSSTAPACRR
jgi:hypothetical protein